MNFEWNENKVIQNLDKNCMKEIENEMDDELRPEYDLSALKVRRVGAERVKFDGQIIKLAPDVAEIFPDSEAVNEALRFLIRITRGSGASFPMSQVGS